ncbi:MAG: ABC-type transport auxiliary lipoprotein family protein [Candidatus Competibacterales bacterium]|nr:ABC-type transport auxiliary lipoprotein family protein [Candidatus Competibacterales bacterium]
MTPMRILILAVTLLTGCAIERPPVDPDTYVLDAVGDPAVAGERGATVLLVTPPRAEPGYEGTGIAYVETPLRLDYYTRSRWAAPPAQMLAPLLVATLERSGAFRAVATLPSSVAADYQLDLTLLQLRQRFLERPSTVELALRVHLIDTRDSRMLASRRFETVETAPSDDAYGGVQAANRALGRLLTEIADYVARQVGGPPRE